MKLAFPLWVHEALAIFTLLLTVYAVAAEIRYLIYNHLLGHQVAEEFEAGRTEQVTPNLKVRIV